MVGQPLFEQSALPGGPARDRSWLHISGLPTPLQPALYGRYRHREGLRYLLPGCAGVDGREHPQSQILRIWFHAQRLTHMDQYLRASLLELDRLPFPEALRYGIRPCIDLTLTDEHLLAVG